MTFVERTLELIKKNNITKNKMLTDLKLGKNSFVNWQERGTIPSGDVLQKIADYFNVSVDYLLGTTPTVQAFDENDNVVVIDDETRDIIDSLRTNPEIKILFSVTKKATKEDIIKAVKIIEALKDDEG